MVEGSSIDKEILQIYVLDFLERILAVRDIGEQKKASRLGSNIKRKSAVAL